MRYLRAFGAFWYDFLVGDRPELFVGPLAALAAVWLLLQAHVESGIAGLALFVAVVLVGGVSLYLTLPRRN
jgi:O-antigen ligase